MSKNSNPANSNDPAALVAEQEPATKAQTTKSSSSFDVKKIWLLLVFLLIAGLVAVSWLEFFDQSVSKHLKQVLAESLVAFASSRTIAAGIALLQGIEVNVGIGLSGTLAPFAFLEPIAEVADDFGDLMRVSIVSIILQEFLLVIVSSIYFKVFISLAGFWLALVVFLRRQFNTNFWAFKTFIFAIFLRFSVLVAVGLSIGINNLLLENTLSQHVEKVQAFANEVDLNSDHSSLTLEERETIKQAANKPFLTELKDSASKFADKVMQIKSKIEDSYNNFGNLVMDMMFVMAAFLFRTLIMPVGFLYALLLVFRKVWGIDYKTAASRIKDKVKQEF